MSGFHVLFSFFMHCLLRFVSYLGGYLDDTHPVRGAGEFYLSWLSLRDDSLLGPCCLPLLLLTEVAKMRVEGSSRQHVRNLPTLGDN